MSAHQSEVFRTTILMKFKSCSFCCDFLDSKVGKCCVIELTVQLFTKNLNLNVYVGMVTIGVT
jgi:hypothetical protein